ncbi:hypothetical protein [Spirulina sp. 06S082]|uniref:hypothetical protein n=1 Tax=Spirulina sp. 06S082 TaxID=3110248 RepID=UPI002B1F0C01|nr:hypothetical protein [Spirulina sp. 06S082]MEA5472250.1 hypothetical protein [Spirulina sp. 06S082]
MRIIETQLNREKNPSVWAAIFTIMPILLNGDREQATQIFDLFIQILASNLYETRLALETLDRKPTSISYLPPR